MSINQFRYYYQRAKKLPPKQLIKKLFEKGNNYLKDRRQRYFDYKYTTFHSFADTGVINDHRFTIGINDIPVAFEI